MKKQVTFDKINKKVNKIYADEGSFYKELFIYKHPILKSFTPCLIDFNLSELLITSSLIESENYKLNLTKSVYNMGKFLNSLHESFSPNI